MIYRKPKGIIMPSPIEEGKKTKKPAKEEPKIEEPKAEEPIPEEPKPKRATRKKEEPLE